MGLLHLFSLLLALLVLVPIGVLFFECMAAVAFRQPRRPDVLGDRRPRLAVLVPAHNEERLVATTLETLQPELAEGDRILVVAHNCTDGTASVAREAGALVHEAADDGTGGKPDAVTAGLEALDQDPPEIVAIIDADCTVEPGSLEALARAAARTQGPVQGIYLFRAPEGSSGTNPVSKLALTVKNWVRPLGLHHLGLPCLLNGSGSAYPFEVLRKAPHGKGSIAEDYQLSIDLALVGHPTRFCPGARILSELPTQERTAYKQRKRWEHGHLQLFLRTAPRLLLRGFFGGNLPLFVPPLAFLVLFWLVAFLLGGLVWLAGEGSTAGLFVLAGGALLFLSILGSSLRFLGLRETASILFRVPLYVAWKVPLYLAYLFNREKRWTKTSRDVDPAPSDDT